MEWRKLHPRNNTDEELRSSLKAAPQIWFLFALPMLPFLVLQSWEGLGWSNPVCFSMISIQCGWGWWACRRELSRRTQASQRDT